MNEQISQAVDGRVKAVNSELAKLEELKQSRVAIQAKLDKLQSDEQAALDGKMAESEAITALTNIHALKAVYGVKTADATAKIAGQEKVVLAAGLKARAFVAHCQQLLATHKLDQAIAFVTEYFVGNPLGDARHLALQSKGYIESLRLGDELSALLEPGQEIGFGLPRLAGNWKALRAACASEPDFTVEFPASWLD